MPSRAFKLRFRRRLRLRKRQVEELGVEAERQLEFNFFRRLEHLRGVRRFVAVWVLLFVLLGGFVVAQMQGLSAFYQHIAPAPGGIYTEGVLGAYTNANPMYATGAVDETVSKLLFAGLLTYDEHNQLTGDLARDWSVDAQGTTYTVHLRRGLTWQDGQPLTSADVAFTFQTIQNPDAQSPLGAGWQGVQIAAPDPLTVRFTLPNVLASFPYSLTTGIVPKHLLQNVTVSSLRTNPFNTARPVGAGPFKFKALEVSGNSADNRQERIALSPFERYRAGPPKLGGFVVRSFRDQNSMVAAYKKQELTAVVGLDSVPRELAKDPDTQVHDMPLTAAVMTFFRTTQGVLSDATVRQALVRAADTSSIIQSLGYPTLPVREPLLINQLGYNPAYAQADYDPAAANAMLDAAGWARGKGGIRYKGGAPLSFKLYAEDAPEYANVTRQLAKQWRAVGADVQVALEGNSDFQTTLASHGYDALLYGISIGQDPDVFVYWDSTQADIRSTNRLNFSEYKSGAADVSLEAGRTRLDPSLRVIKYQPFLQAWQSDAPALGLYEPRFLYITHGTVYGLDDHAINTDVGRLAGVQNWMIREVRTSAE